MHVDSKSTGSINQAKYKMNDNILESKLDLKDLGVIVDNHLIFSNHIADKVNKANQIMGLREIFVFLDKHNLIYFIKSLVRPHIEYENIAWWPFWRADINLIENVLRRATSFIPEIIKLDYQERLEKLDLPALAYRWLVAELLKPTKYCTIRMMPTVSIYSLNLNSQIHMDISLQLKQNYQESALDKNFLAYE